MRPANALNLSPEEKRVFGQLFQQADTENIGVVTGEVAVKFFEKTRLDPHVLGEVSLLSERTVEELFGSLHKRLPAIVC